MDRLGLLRRVLVLVALAGSYMPIVPNVVTNPCEEGVDELLVAFNGKDYERTIEVANAMVERTGPDKCSSLFVVRGRALLQLGRTEAAVEDLENAARIAPFSCLTQTFLALGYREARREEIPTDGLENCLKVEPNDERARWVLASTQLDNKDFDAAAKTFLVLADREPADSESHIMAASALRRAERYPEAKKVLDEALAVNARSVFAHEETGQWHYDREEYEEALAWFDKTIELGTDANEDAVFIAAYLDSRARAWLGLSELDKAKEDAERSFATKEDAAALLTLARVEFELGNAELGCQQLGRAAAMQPRRTTAEKISELAVRCE